MSVVRTMIGDRWSLGPAAATATATAIRARGVRVRYGPTLALAGVDSRSEATITALLRELAAEGRTILIATHDLVAVPALCDAVSLVNRRIIATGPPSDVLVPSLLAEAFGGFVPEAALRGHQPGERWT